MKKIVLFIAIFIVAILNASGVDVKVSSTQIAKGESLKVKIIADGKDVKFPNITDIGGYPVENIRTSSLSTMQFINGKFSTKTQKQMSFILYPEKSIKIPSFKVQIDGKTYRSDPIDIKVVSPTQASSGHGFYITMRADRKKVYMGEPFLLYVDVVEPGTGEISRIEYNPPKFGDFIAKSLGGEKQYHKNGKVVHELAYLLIPQKPGKQKILPASGRVGIRALNTPGDPFGIFGNAISWTNIRSSALDIDVLPVPVDTDLIGDFKVSASVDKRTVEANRPVNYTLVIEGRGSLDTIDDPVFKIPGVTVYSDDAKVTMELRGGVPYSRYVKKYAFISDRSFTIPSLKLKEFDYTTKKSKTLSTKSFDITVKGSSSTSQTPRVTGQLSSTTPKTEAKADNKKQKSSENLFEDESYYSKKAQEERAKKELWIKIALFLAGVLVGAVGMKIFSSIKPKSKRGSKSHRKYSQEEALKILYPHINESSEVEEIVRSLYDAKAGKGKVDENKMNELCAKYDRE